MVSDGHVPEAELWHGSGTWVDERAQRQGPEKPHGELWSSFCNVDGMGSYDEGRWFYHSHAGCFRFSGIQCGGKWHRPSNNGAREPQPDTGHHRQQGFQTQSRRCYCSVFGGCRISGRWNESVGTSRLGCDVWSRPPQSNHASPRHQGFPRFDSSSEVLDQRNHEEAWMENYLSW